MPAVVLQFFQPIPNYSIHFFIPSLSMIFLDAISHPRPKASLGHGSISADKIPQPRAEINIEAEAEPSPHKSLTAPLFLRDEEEKNNFLSCN
ncbi:hypothetical protein JTE90_002562 [Oedothorax gibbosus]|uniref:Uncharacterized protein n=1 Tax=Oedothorax gibbosus TaxID=931172 RepID=A0AAV6V2D1_9ARAC|nr:hypothetical protein JTE90_002562 [Oedothorax gibbosus]